MIVTSATLLSNKMVAEEDTLINELVESSFQLDLFDHGMNICFSHLMGTRSKTEENINLEQSLIHFMNRSKQIMEEQGIKLSMNITSPASIKGDRLQISTITNTIINEMLTQSSKMLSVVLNGNMFTVTADNFRSPPEVWVIFKDVLKYHNIDFFYEGNTCTLEYL